VGAEGSGDGFLHLFKYSSEFRVPRSKFELLATRAGRPTTVPSSAFQVPESVEQSRASSFSLQSSFLAPRERCACERGQHTCKIAAPTGSWRYDV
jgi:hypothetical protein